MPKRLIIFAATLCTVGVVVLLTFQNTRAVDSSGIAAGRAALASSLAGSLADTTGTPQPTASESSQATKPPTSTPGPTNTAVPTSTPVKGVTPAVRPTLVQGPPPGLGGSGGPAGQNSVLIDPLIDKTFVAAGFPGVSTGLDSQGYYQYAKNRQSEPTLWAVWYIQVQQAGYYNVYAYIPSNPNATHAAQFHIFQNDTLSPPIVIDETLSSGQWVNLGSYYFVNAAVDAQSVTLDNDTAEADSTTTVLFSTVYVVFRP